MPVSCRYNYPPQQPPIRGYSDDYSRRRIAATPADTRRQAPRSTSQPAGSRRYSYHPTSSCWAAGSLVNRQQAETREEYWAKLSGQREATRTHWPSIFNTDADRHQSGGYSEARRENHTPRSSFNSRSLWSTRDNSLGSTPRVSQFGNDHFARRQAATPRAGGARQETSTYLPFRDEQRQPSDTTDRGAPKGIIASLEQDRQAQQSTRTEAHELQQRPLEPVAPPSPPAIPTPPYLPLRDQRKPTLVLDLDETLVHSSFDPTPADICFPIVIEDEHYTVYVRKRPNVELFLRRCCELFEVAIWTASLSVYAEPLIEQLLRDSGRGLTVHKLYREHCSQMMGGFVKDLRHLGRPLERTIIIDNTPNAALLQPTNLIAIKSWYDDVSDKELTKMLPLLERLSCSESCVQTLAVNNSSPNWTA